MRSGLEERGHSLEGSWLSSAHICFLLTVMFCWFSWFILPFFFLLWCRGSQLKAACMWGNCSSWELQPQTCAFLLNGVFISLLGSQQVKTCFQLLCREKKNDLESKKPPLSHLSKVPLTYDEPCRPSSGVFRRECCQLAQTHTLCFSLAEAKVVENNIWGFEI